MKRNAYLLTCNENSKRSIFSKKILEKIGFNVCISKCINLGVKHKEKILSNKLSMYKIYETIAESDCEYSYVFEDDINVVEEIKLPEIAQYESISEMFFYLGACFPDPKMCNDTGIRINDHVVYSTNGHVRCLHAIGLSKRGAKELLCFYKTENKDFMDMILEKFSTKFKANIVRFDLVSPCDKNHRGIVFQDRIKFQSSI